MEPETADKSPFFIVGSPRSGTTLLQTLLDAHPALCIPPESHVFDHFGEIFRCYGDLGRPGNAEKFVRDLLSDERIKRWGLEIKPAEFCRPLRERTLREIVSRLFGLYADLRGKARWGDKTPEHTLHMQEIRSVFPDACFIHLVRDGRDVAESLGRTFFGPPTVDQRALQWKQYVNAFEDFKSRYPEACLTVRYEDLVQNPPEVMGRILSFLGESTDSIPKEIPQSALKNVYLNTDDGTHQSLQDALSPAKIGLYKKRMSRREIEIAESIAGTELQRYGYSLESSGREGVRPHEKLFFFLAHQFRFLKKLNHPGYLKDRLQYHLRKRLRKLGGGP